MIHNGTFLEPFPSHSSLVAEDEEPVRKKGSFLSRLFS